MIVRNATKAAVLADKARRAATFTSRLVGLLNRAKLEPGEALILDPSNSIHSFFMRFRFDALFLDKNNKVVGIIHSMRPFRISPIFFTSVKTIELPGGVLKSTSTGPGDTITITS